MKSTQILEHLGKLIAGDKLKEAIKKMSDLLKGSPLANELIVQSARYSDVMRQIRLGVIEYENANITKNQIRLALVEMTGLIEEAATSQSALDEEVSTAADLIKISNSKNVNTGNISAGDNVIIGDQNNINQ